MTIRITYATGNLYKKAELQHILRTEEVSVEGTSSKFYEAFDIDFVGLGLPEQMDVDLEKLINAKAELAYSRLRRPCMVEYAGLILERHEPEGYPGGLTQPMWDTLGAKKFVTELGGDGTEVFARAYVGYCDGLTIQTFSGVTKGVLKGMPTGSRDYYWDTVFLPHGGGGRTYAEICPDEKPESLKAKVRLSQSAKAIRKFLEFRINSSSPELFPNA